VEKKLSTNASWPGRPPQVLENERKKKADADQDTAKIKALQPHRRSDGLEDGAVVVEADITTPSMWKLRS
jgi:hypothetical protein